MKVVLYFFILFTYYILGAYATTDIVRLLKGSTLPVNEPDCYCPNCNNKILLRDQIPILSYFLNRKKCRHCNAVIHFSDIFLEIFVFAILSLFTLLLKFQPIAFPITVITYEAIKLFYLMRVGKRETAFCQNLVKSFSQNILIFALLFIEFFILQLIR